MVIGSPGKVIRTLDENAAALLKLSADHYAANWRRFAKELAPLP
jgi:carbonic anhydrase/acetyltransferase-like protein (isoleucine patch superfamily)